MSKKTLRFRSLVFLLLLSGTVLTRCGGSDEIVNDADEVENGTDSDEVFDVVEDEGDTTLVDVAAEDTLAPCNPLEQAEGVRISQPVVVEDCAFVNPYTFFETFETDDDWQDFLDDPLSTFGSCNQEPLENLTVDFTTSVVVVYNRFSVHQGITAESAEVFIAEDLVVLDYQIEDTSSCPPMATLCDGVVIASVIPRGVEVLQCIHIVSDCE